MRSRCCHGIVNLWQESVQVAPRKLESSLTFISAFSPLSLLTESNEDFNHGLVLGIGASTKILLSKIFVFVDVTAVADFDSDTATPVPGVDLVSSLTETVEEDIVSSFVVGSRPTSGPQDFDRSGDSAADV